MPPKILSFQTFARRSGCGKRALVPVRWPWVPSLAFPLPDCVTLDKSLDVSES